jgi:cold shock CspA family protein
MYKGRLDKWDAGKGYGFIRSEQLSSDTFIHISALKHMSRQPVAGDIIFFEVGENKGKKCATNARIEGVTRKFPSEHHNNGGNKSSKTGVYFIAVIIIVGLFFFIKSSPNVDYIQPSTPFTFSDNTHQHNFTCDGRQHCSQMTSRAEAVFFIRNCPNTKMDGDNDGVPCENDSRF